MLLGGFLTLIYVSSEFVIPNLIFIEKIYEYEKSLKPTFKINRECIKNIQLKIKYPRRHI